MSIEKKEPLVEAYETDEGVVLYDARNPLAWVKSDKFTRLDDHS